MDRMVLHCDLNNFYASCEYTNDMSLIGKPVAVCGSVEDRHGIVLSKNYPAKDMGVKTGEVIWQAKQKCPDLIVVEPHYGLYMKYSALVHSIYEQYSDRVESFGMDEAWIDVSGKGIGISEAEKIAHEIRRRVKSETGLTISAGVSFNKVFAKLGSDMKKPDAVTVIPKETFKDIIYDLPASDLLGVGRATAKVLDSYCITTIGKLAAMPMEFYKAKFGKFGVMLWEYANGLDTSPVRKTDAVCPAKSFGHGTTTRVDLTTSEDVWNVMLELCQDLGSSLRGCGMKAQGVSIVIRDDSLFVKQWQTKLKIPTQSASAIAKTAFNLFQRSYRWEKPIRSVTVTAIDLISGDSYGQISFFDDLDREEKTENLEKCVEELRGRFGKKIVIPAAILDNHKTNISEIKLKMPGMCV